VELRPDLRELAKPGEGIGVDALRLTVAATITTGTGTPPSRVRTGVSS